MKKMIYFHEYFPAFRSISIIQEGICIETFIKKGKKSRFVIMDRKGNREREIYLPDAEPGRIKMMAKFTYTIFDNFYYYFRENIERESWELMKEKM